MTTTTIKPTVGRIVWYYPAVNCAESGFASNSGDQPLAAIIARVWHDRMVNLTVFDANGVPHARTSVPLLQDLEDSGTSAFCTWMPYQKGQAAKTEAAEKAESAPAPAEYRQPSQREQLEFALVSGAAAHLSAHIHEADRIAEGIKKVLDKLHPQPVLFNPHTGTPRDHRDIASDPKAILCVKPGEPLKAAPITLPVIAPVPDYLEREIQAKADKCPRVTPADVEAEISAEYSFTLDKALAGCPLLDGLERVTIAVLVLRNGSKLVGVNYGAIDPTQHSPEMGAKEARAAAVEQIWPLLGFRLRDELARPVLTDADADADLAGTQRPSQAGAGN